MRRAFLLPTLLLLAVTPPCIDGQPGPIQQKHALDARGYLAELGRVETACAVLTDHPEAASELRKSLPTSWRVEIDGQLFVVSADWLQADLDSLGKHPKNAAATSKRIQSRLQALRAEVSPLVRQPQSPPPLAARAKLEEILSRREFRNAQEPAWLAQFRRRLSTWLLEALEALFGGVRVPPRATKTLGWVLAIGLPLVFLIWLIRQFLHLHLRRAAAPFSPPLSQERWRDWAGRATAAAAQGHYREAVRLAYWAGVYRLEESGVWQVDRARTPREYLRLVPAGHPNQAPLSTLTARFERIWYGGQAATAEDFDFTRTRLEELGCAFPSTPATGNS
jgi:hypothetical protein